MLRESRLTVDDHEASLEGRSASIVGPLAGGHDLWEGGCEFFFLLRVCAVSTNAAIDAKGLPFFSH